MPSRVALFPQNYFESVCNEYYLGKQLQNRYHEEYIVFRNVSTYKNTHLIINVAVVIITRQNMIWIVKTFKSLSADVLKNALFLSPH